MMCGTVLYGVVICCPVLYCVILCCTVLYCALHCCTVLVHCCTVVHSGAQSPVRWGVSQVTARPILRKAPLASACVLLQKAAVALPPFPPYQASPVYCFL